MKKMMAALLIAALALLSAMTASVAEGAPFSEVAGTYDFASGVGAWATGLTILPDGSFYGDFHDTDMEDSALNGVHYDAICYYADFTGRLSTPERVGAQELDCAVIDLKYDKGAPYVQDGIRYEPVDPYGVALGDRLRFFMKGTDVANLPEGLWEWLCMKAVQPEGGRLTYVAMYNETSGAGFSGPDIDDVWLPEPTAAPEQGGTWSLFVDTPDENVASAVEPEPAPSVREGLTFPVDAEVVNCKQCVSLRSQPSTQGALLAEVPLGEVVQVYSNVAYSGSDRWFVDAAYNGLRGYICIEYLDILLPDAVRAQRQYLQGTAGTISAVNPGTDLLMRSGPGAGYGVTGLLFGGEVLGYLGDARQDNSGTCWYHASYYGAECWISAKYTALTLNDGRTFTGSRGIF